MCSGAKFIKPILLKFVPEDAFQFGIAVGKALIEGLMNWHSMIKSSPSLPDG
jgi:hypothetical protein